MKIIITYLELHEEYIDEHEALKEEDIDEHEGTSIEQESEVSAVTMGSVSRPGPGQNENERTCYVEEDSTS